MRARKRHSQKEHSPEKSISQWVFLVSISVISIIGCIFLHDEMSRLIAEDQANTLEEVIIEGDVESADAKQSETVRRTWRSATEKKNLRDDLSNKLGIDDPGPYDGEPKFEIIKLEAVGAIHRFTMYVRDHCGAYLFSGICDSNGCTTLISASHIFDNPKGRVRKLLPQEPLEITKLECSEDDCSCNAPDLEYVIRAFTHCGLYIFEQKKVQKPVPVIPFRPPPDDGKSIFL